MDYTSMVILFKDKVNGNTYRTFNGLNVKLLVDSIPQNNIFKQIVLHQSRNLLLKRKVIE